MAALTEDASDEWLIAGRSVAEWDERWEHVPNGFREVQSDLKNETGLFTGKQDARIMLIAAAVQTDGGLRAGLARFRLKDQTGNTNYGMKCLRELGDTVEAYVIKMKPATPEDINELKWALIDFITRLATRQRISSGPPAKQNAQGDRAARLSARPPWMPRLT